MEIEKQALSRENDPVSLERLKFIENEAANYKDKENTLKTKYGNEKDEIKKIREIKEKIDRLKGEMEKAERDYDLNKVAEIRYGTLPQLQNELMLEESKQKKGDQLLKEEVTEEEIADIVSKWTIILLEGFNEFFRVLSDCLPSINITKCLPAIHIKYITT
jgi:ATP-dependent Clp protease ATP-binding subunit ClpB